VYGVSRQWPQGPRHQPGPHPSAAIAGSIAITDDPMTRAAARARPIRDFNILDFPFLFLIRPDSEFRTTAEAERSRYGGCAEVVFCAARHCKYGIDMAP
jgi:hypothetical protein